MNIPWRNSLIELQYVVTEKTSIKNSKVAKEHIQCLIDCINELYSDHKNAKEKLEESAIRANGLKHRYQVMERAGKLEMDKTASFAKTENNLTMEKLQKEHNHLENDLKVNKEKVKEVSAENKKLSISAETQKEQAEKLSDCLGTFILQKSDKQIVIKQTRLETHDVQECLNSIAYESEEMATDLEVYWSYCVTQTNAINLRAESWKEKIRFADIELADAKAIYDEVASKNYNAQVIKNNLNKMIAEENEKLQGCLLRAEKYERITKIRKIDFEQSKIDVALLQDEIEQAKQTFEKKSLDQANRHKDVLTDVDFNEEMQEKLISERASINSEKVAKKDFLYSVKTETQSEKICTSRANQMMVTAMNKLVAARSNRMRYKEKLIMKADARSTMKKIYAKTLRRYRQHLQYEVEQRIKAEEDLEISIEMFKMFEKEMEQFRRDSRGLSLGNRFTWEAFEKQKQMLQQELIEAKVKVWKLQFSFNAKFEKYSVYKDSYLAEIKILDERIAVQKEKLNQLELIKSELEPRYDHIRSECLRIENEQDEMSQRFALQNNRRDRLLTENIRLRRKLQGQTTNEKSLQPQLDAIRRTIVIHIERCGRELKSSGIDICMKMKRMEILTMENQTLTDESIHLKEEVDYYSKELKLVHAYLIKQTKKLLHIRCDLVQAVWKESEITKNATIIYGTNLNELINIRGYIDRRKRKLGYATQRLCDIINNSPDYNTLAKTRKSTKKRFSDSDGQVQKRRGS